MNAVARRGRRLGGVALVLTLASTAVSAPAAEPGETARAQGAIEEIVVTSRKRAESIQDIPVSVSAFREEDIAAIQPRNIRDFEGLAPNVSIGMNTAGPSTSAFFIRGIGYAGIEKTNSPAVGLIIDGLYQASNTGNLIDAFDIAQIEINRGPQGGVLYGKNTTGGSIVVKRTEPTGEWGLRTSASYGTDNYRVVKTIANAPVVQDVLALKVGGTWKEQDGFYENVRTGEDEGDVNYWATTISLLFTPTETFDAQLTFDRVEDTSDIPPQDPRYNGPDPFENEADFDEDVKYYVSRWGLEMNWSTPWGELTSISGWTDSNDRVEQDFDGSTRGTTAQPLVQLHTGRDQRFTYFTEELRWAGNFTDRIDYLVGGYYFQSDHNHRQTSNQFIQIGNPLPAGTPCSVIGFFDNPNPDIGNSLCQLGPILSEQFVSHDVESWAAFGNVNWLVTEDIEFSVGGRYIDEQKTFDNRYLNLTDPNAETSTVPLTHANWDDFILTASLNWQVTDNNLLYTSYGEGFRSGGFSLRGTGTSTCPDCAGTSVPIIGTSPDGTPVIASPITYDPEEVWSVEIGSKNDLFDGLLRANFAAFYTLLEGPQESQVLTTPGITPGTNTVINNLDEVEIKGLEATFEWLPTENLMLRLVGGYQDAERKEFELDGTLIPAGPQGQAGAPGLRQFPSGEPTRVPDWNYSVSANYRKQIGVGEMNAYLAWSEKDDMLLTTDLRNIGGIEQESHGLLDASIGYEWTTTAGTIWRVSVWGKNLTDEEYLEQALPLGDNGGFQGWGPPRTGAVELQVSL